ncbi:DUF2853 family protein [Sandaracinobacteroides saxicola]|uniref:DUF2853 family protein n=1 Tax=Sandaracinobacteroides saxicola TaxID=2759707 RepID=A0A7G5IHD3_9SPHN|nr:DUF2853 family protein [Sandaracinobacteroides saxicola]QMW22775.1 DUF2853 family protein [Sandaracinobacteroides saxicola]
MAEDWAIDVRKYAPDADDAVIAGIVRYCGIALRTRDASLVSFSDKAETDRVRDGFCRKKLALTEPDEVVDAAIARVGERMAGDPTKNRVTVYYLLAEAFGKLGLFGAASAAVAEPVVAPAAAPVMAPAMATVAAMPAAAMAAPALAVPAAPADNRSDTGFMLTVLGTLGAIIVGAAIVSSLATGRSDDVPTLPSAPPVAVAAPVVAPAPAAPAAPAIPDGAGVIAAEVEGKPMVSVYFDTAKTDIAPDFVTATASVKAYLAANPSARAAVSGYNDPTGDAAFNAELSKNRAQAVKAALVASGVPDASIDLVKPADTTDSTTDMANARRVDIVVTGG